jgi:hypothetical protein
MEVNLESTIALSASAAILISSDDAEVISGMDA